MHSCILIESLNLHPHWNTDAWNVKFIEIRCSAHGLTIFHHLSSQTITTIPTIRMSHFLKERSCLTLKDPKRVSPSICPSLCRCGHFLPRFCPPDIPLHRPEMENSTGSCPPGESASLPRHRGLRLQLQRQGGTHGLVAGMPIEAPQTAQSTREKKRKKATESNRELRPKGTTKKGLRDSLSLSLFLSFHSAHLQLIYNPLTFIYIHLQCATMCYHVLPSNSSIWSAKLG